MVRWAGAAFASASIPFSRWRIRSRTGVTRNTQAIPAATVDAATAIQARRGRHESRAAARDGNSVALRNTE
jgi:hypothetical protein